MSSTKPGWLAIAAVAAMAVGSQVIPATTHADPAAEPQPAPRSQTRQDLHNVIYRARADGTSRGAVVAYKMDDQNVNSAEPTLLPGRMFEVNAVLADPQLAGMQISIQWPYGSNLHCEIEVDGETVAQADQFIAPRLLRPKDDPMYGVLQCGAPLDIPVAGGNAVNTNPVDTAIPADGAVPPPGQPAPPPAA
jgi:hypothetical protein